MTHGDKAKAKTGKSSQASAAKKSSSPAKENGRKGIETKGPGKGGAQSPGKGGAQSAGKGGEAGRPASQISLKKTDRKAGPAAAKVPPAPAGKEGSAKAAAKGRADESPAFANPAVAAAFKHAVKKYPNAFRKLTD